MKTDIKRLLSDIRIKVHRELNEKLMNEILDKSDVYIQHAQANGEYQDRTGYLRNESFEMGVSVEGQVITQNTKKAKEKFKKEGMKYPENGFSVFLLSNADYADIVEAKGYNVLTKTSYFMEDDIRKMLIKKENQNKNNKK
ncbi:MAG: hypothetical protein UIG52_00675 [Bacteroidales bacterium]|nr:hypothetical protein [Bacteroidales bacterium]